MTNHQHPGIKLRFCIYGEQGSPIEIYNKLKAAITSLSQYTLENENDEKLKLIATWKSKVIGWIHIIKFHVKEQFGEVIVVGESTSTGILPGWIGVQLSFSMYRDHSLNKKHLIEIMNHTKCKYEMRLVENRGLH